MGIRDLTWGSPRFTTVVDNGPPARRLNIGILGDGYRTRDLPRYRRDVAAIIDEFRRTEPLATYFPHLNFHRIDAASIEAGTDDLWADPPITRRTALDTGYSPVADRRLVGPSSWVMTVATMSGAPWDYLLVVVNYAMFGGATDLLMLVGYVSNGTRTRAGGTSAPFPTTAVHEAGHSIAKLADEYTGDLPDIDFPPGWTPPDVLPWVNVTTEGTNPKWSVWVDAGTPLPTPQGVAGNPVGAFAGAFNVSALFRPKRDCYMRSHGVPFCEVCGEQWLRTIYQQSPIADTFTPSPAPLPLFVTPNQQVTFRADLVRPGGTGIRAIWETRRATDAGWTTRQDTANYQDFSSAFPLDTVGRLAAPTAWLVRCRLSDTTPRIRTTAVADLARQEVTWNVVSASQVTPHGDTFVGHGDVSLVPHGDGALVPHGDMMVLHGDGKAIPHGDVAAGAHGDSPIVPHGDGFVVPHGDIPTVLHGDTPLVPHVDTPLLPHGDVPALLHGDATAFGFHVDTPSGLHVDTASVGHADTPPMGHVDTPGVGHVDTPPGGHIDTAPAGHVDISASGHVDSPASGHVDTPGAHVDTPAVHADTPATAHVDTPPAHVDVP